MCLVIYVYKGEGAGGLFGARGAREGWRWGTGILTREGWKIKWINTGEEIEKELGKIKWVDWKVIIRCQYFGVKKRGGDAGTYSWDLGVGGGGITIEKIPDLRWLEEHIGIRSRIPVQIVANKAQHMCYTFIHSFTYCTLHVGLLDILYFIYITCATHTFI